MPNRVNVQTNDPNVNQIGRGINGILQPTSLVQEPNSIIQQLMRLLGIASITDRNGQSPNAMGLPASAQLFTAPAGSRDIQLPNESVEGTFGFTAPNGGLVRMPMKEVKR